MDGGQRAVQPRGGTQFLEGQSGLLVEQRLELVLLPGDRAGLAAGAVMLRTHVARASSLLQELLDHAQRNPKATSHRLAGALARVIGGQNPFPQIQRDAFHARSLPQPRTNGYIII